MATLYVENVPDDLYKALRERARERHHSIAAEVLSLLGESVPTAQELRARRDLLRKLEQIRSKKSSSGRSSTEEMQRQDRRRKPDCG
jgi:plasmid stability protein